MIINCDIIDTVVTQYGEACLAGEDEEADRLLFMLESWGVRATYDPGTKSVMWISFPKGLG